MQNKTYKCLRTGELVRKWRWCWRGVYTLPEQVQLQALQARGSAVPEYVEQFNDTEGVMRPFSDIEQERLRYFEVYEAENPQNRYRIVMQAGMRLLFMRRQTHVGFLGKTYELFVVGYKHGNTHCFMYLMPNGTTYVSPTDDIDVPNLMLYAELTR